VNCPSLSAQLKLKQAQLKLKQAQLNPALRPPREGAIVAEG
jgi:hypothetical protein